MNKDIETLREAARLLSYDFKDMPDKLRALADRMEQQSKAEPLTPDRYWLPCNADAGFDCPDDAEIINGKKLGEVFTLNEAHYFDAQFKVTKVPDDESDDYEIERISGTDIFTHPPADARDAELLEIVNAVIDWNTKYPSSRVYNYGTIHKIANEMDAIFERAKAAIAAKEGK